PPQIERLVAHSRALDRHLHETKPGPLRQLMRIDENSARVAEHDCIETRIASAADVERRGQIRRRAGRHEGREPAGVVRIDKDDGGKRQPDDPETSDEKEPRTAPPGPLRYELERDHRSVFPRRSES